MNPIEKKKKKQLSNANKQKIMETCQIKTENFN
jgi:hypothetical protein